MTWRETESMIWDGVLAMPSYDERDGFSATFFRDAPAPDAPRKPAKPLSGVEDESEEDREVERDAWMDNAVRAMEDRS